MLIACHFVSFRHSRVKFYKADLLTFCQACRWRCEVFSGSWCQYCTAFDAMFVVRDNVHSCFHCHTVLRRTVIRHRYSRDRRYASAVPAMALCLSVCLSACVCHNFTSRSSMETTGRVELVSARELHSYNNNNITFIHSQTRI